MEITTKPIQWTKSIAQGIISQIIDLDPIFPEKTYCSFCDRVCDETSQTFQDGKTLCSLCVSNAE